MTDRAPETRAERPAPAWVVGTCPDCGEVLVFNHYWQGGWGYVRWDECWSALGEEPTCAFRRAVR